MSAGFVKGCTIFLFVYIAFFLGAGMFTLGKIYQKGNYDPTLMGAGLIGTSLAIMTMGFITGKYANSTEELK